MDRSFDFILAGIALIVGIMLLTGHGDIFLKGGNTKLRKEKYDEKKMTKGSGVTLILFGIVTFIDSYTDYLGVEELWVKIKNKLDNYDLSEDVIRSYCLLVDRNKYKDKTRHGR